MRAWILPAVVLSLGLGLSATASAAPPMAAARAAGPASAVHRFGFHHGIRYRFVPPGRLFRRPHLAFGAGFAAHRVHALAAGGYGDYGYGSDEDYDSDTDDIENLHFLVQEPFGPGDIGRPPVAADEDVPYMSERRDSEPGYAREQ